MITEKEYLKEHYYSLLEEFNFPLFVIDYLQMKSGLDKLDKWSNKPKSMGGSNVFDNYKGKIIDKKA